MKDKGSIHIELPVDVRKIISRLNEAGYEAFAVGGCIRDSILGREPEDWDITTSATPHEIKRVFERTVDTGIKHGTVTVLIKHGLSEVDPEKYELRPYEVTTYRIDGEYKDGRHPEKVSFTPLLREDLRRRDFTINAMAYNDDTGLVDEFEGLLDMERKLIRCVGDPDERFTEDALRILRAARFSAQIGFETEKETRSAIRRHAANLSKVSKERIQAELAKLICSAHPEKVLELSELGMQEQICSGFGELDLGIFSEIAGDEGFSEIPVRDRYRRYAVLLSGCDEESCRSILRELRVDNDTLHRACLLVKKLFVPIESDAYAIKLAMQDMDPELFSELLELKRRFSGTVRYRRSCGGEDVTALGDIFRYIMRREDPIYQKDLIVKGSDLIKAGMEPGERLGSMLRDMHDEVLRHPEHNSILFLFNKYFYGG